MNFCSHCGSDKIELKIPEGDNLPRYCCDHCGRIHYQNPNMVVGCLPVYQDQILLCKRAIEPCYGLWNLPAGYLENGETVEQGALRETWEESFAKVELIRLHCVYNLPHVNQVYLHFLAHMQQPEFSESPESLEVRLFSEKDIPWSDIAFSSSTFALKKYFEFKGQNFQGVHMGTLRKQRK